MRDYHPDDYERRENPVHDAAEATTFVRVRSRRAADKLGRLLGVSKLDWHFNMWEGNSFALIPTRSTAATPTP